MLAIIASMERELSGLRREISSDRSVDSLDLRVVGVGKPRRKSGLREILRSNSDGQPRGVLMLGFAGAVDRKLKTGDVVISSRYYLDDPDEGFLVPGSAIRQSAIIAAVNTGLPVTYLDSLTVDAIVATPEAKAELAGCYPVGIVEMEDYWLAMAARESGVPFISARVVLDTAQQSLPSYLMGLSQGRPVDVLRAVVTPWRVPALLRLACQAHVARQALSRFALSFIRQWEREGHHLTAANVSLV